MPSFPRLTHALSCAIALVCTLAAGAPPLVASVAFADPAPADCGGQATITSGTTTLTCTFDDEFDGTNLDPSRWSVTTSAGDGYHSGNQACFVNDPSNIAVAGGYLDLTAHQLASPMTCNVAGGTSYSADYTSGSVSSRYDFSQTYGEFSVRAAFPSSAISGLQSSLWLWPESVDRYGGNSGEIDIAEEYSQYADRAIPFLHYHPATSPTVISADSNGDNAVGANIQTDDYCYVSDVSAFHTYTAIWTPSYIQILFDGQNCMTDYYSPAAPLSSPEPFDEPFFVNLTQALGIGTNAFQPGVTPVPATTQVDWVRVWGATAS